MRQFTKEEKELIINTPITPKCFDAVHNTAGVKDGEFVSDYWDVLCTYFENIRWWCIHAEDKDMYFSILISMLPNSYKVVKL